MKLFLSLISTMFEHVTVVMTLCAFDFEAIGVIEGSNFKLLCFHEEKNKNKKNYLSWSLIIVIHTNVRLFGSRSRPSSCRSWQGPNCFIWLFADDKSHRGQDYPHILISLFGVSDQSKVFVKTVCIKNRIDKMSVLIRVQTVCLGCHDVSQE